MFTKRINKKRLDNPQLFYSHVIYYEILFIDGSFIHRTGIPQYLLGALRY